MNRIIAALVLVSGLAFAGAAHAESAGRQDALESMGAELLLTGPAKGYVLVRDCRDCPKKFPVNGNTRAELKGQAISLKEAQARVRQGVTVIFDKKTGVVDLLLLM